MAWYKQEDFDEKTNEFFEWLMGDSFFFGSSPLIKNHFINVNLHIDCTSWKQIRDKRLTVSIINKDAIVDLFRIMYKDNKIQYINSSLDIVDFIQFISKFKQECDNYFVKYNQRTVEERTNNDKFENNVRTEFLSKFLSN